MGQTKIKIAGGGLAGVEACYQLAKKGYNIELYEMRPEKMTPIHKTGGLCELVCSNSLKSTDINTPQGLLKYELEKLDSLVLRCAKSSAVPAGGALAVDRYLLSELVEKELSLFPNIAIIREELTEISDFTILATGPLTSGRLGEKIAEFLGSESLYFYDAVAPIITLESIDTDKAFFQGRYQKGGEDYINCPLTKEQYIKFREELSLADRVIEKKFGNGEIFNACMPIEEMAKKGEDTMRFGPMRPVGLIEPSTGKRPYAAVQLRKEDNYNKLYNIVGFQTNLKFGEQERVFKLIPALENAEFIRYGVMHRNTFINSPKVLKEDFSAEKNPTIYFAGQLCGVEGYMESAASGLISALSMDYKLRNKAYTIPSANTAIGSLARYISGQVSNFQPMHVSYALMPELENFVKDKAKRKQLYSQRAMNDIDNYVKQLI